MKASAEHKDKKAKALFVKDLARGERGNGATDEKHPGADSSPFTTLIVGEEGPDGA